MDKLKKIIDRCKGRFLLETNLHKDNYQTVQEYLQELEFVNEDIFNEISKDVIKKMIENDSVLHIHFYPNTPVGFYCLYHYDLDKLIDEAYDILFRDKQ